MFPSRQAFRDLARRGNLIPVWQDVLLDLDTPVSAFLKLTEPAPSSPYGGGSRAPLPGFLLESVEGGEKWASYSFLAAAPRTTLRIVGRDVTVEQGGEAIETDTADDPMRVVERWLGARVPVGTEDLPRFFGGAVGYLGYDMVRRWERLPERAPDALTRDGQTVPDGLLYITDTLVVFDNLKHKARVLSLADLEDERVGGDPDVAYTIACERVEEMLDALRAPVPGRPRPRVRAPLQVESNFERAQFEAAVLRAKEYVRAGDIIQVVLSQRFAAEAPDVDPFDVYRALRTLNPSPYMFFLRFPELTLTGASPEVLVRVEDGVVETRPIAGTRPRGRTPDEDRVLEAELKSDPKELAEHIMLVDLGRNDLGRVCEIGSVTVPERMAVERYSHVMHLVSGVHGRLRKDLTPFDALRAAFPAGTLSGAPKVRAMEIIEELEPSRRGPYGGAVGYFGYGGNLDLCIAIRALLAQEGRFSVQAGAGLVADSDPAMEYEETVNKSRAVLRAIEMARQGL